MPGAQSGIRRSRPPRRPCERSGQRLSFRVSCSWRQIDRATAVRDGLHDPGPVPGVKGMAAGVRIDQPSCRNDDRWHPNPPTDIRAKAVSEISLEPRNGCCGSPERFQRMQWKVGIVPFDRPDSDSVVIIASFDAVRRDPESRLYGMLRSWGRCSLPHAVRASEKHGKPRHLRVRRQHGTSSLLN